MSSSSYKYPNNCSKAQMCFFKILHIISSIPSTNEEPSPSHGDDRPGSYPNNNRGIDIDLNLTPEESESYAIDDQAKNNVGEEEVEPMEDNEVGNAESEPKEDKEGKDKEDGEGDIVKTVSSDDNNCPNMLIEAGKEILELEGEVKEGKENLNGDDVEETHEDSLHNDNVEEARVVVTWKSTRTRVLPARYRDEKVVKPLKRKRRRSSTSQAKKRRVLRS